MARKVGRPSSLTPGVREALLQAFKLGATVKIACGAVGVGEATYYRWLAKGREQKTGQYRDFREAVHRATQRGDLELLAIVRKAARTDGRLALDVLARRHPDAYARKDKHTVKHTGHDGGAIKVAAVSVDLGAMSVDQLRAMLSEDVIDAAEPDAKPPRLVVKQGDQ